ncbi:hypothetical protein BKA66DRAFT_450728 [Pyrenochaeta sp. MPI-SDFR-AT-0127]|nr:hypothetical protein BKA66DRAFT_450728 [Pyrenochaeta sp. MPI-SDFR-AT-0127]
MTLPRLRDLVLYPEGDSSSSTIINGMRFNLTALEEFGYTLYSNRTLSNGTQCYLVFDSFKPSMLNNGTWVNETTCYIPYYSIQTRGMLSIAFGSLFGVILILTLINLRKHGKLYLREDKRFRVVGRRWQWYWMLFVAACGMISTLTGVDIDRYYLQDLPIILQSFFFMLMIPGALAMVWEGTRHWGSWQERQVYDADPFLLPQDDCRARTEFWLPLVFYLFAFLNFFMVIPRSWTAVQKQNTDWQKENIARPAATDAREKAGAILAICAWMVICYSLWHSTRHYTRGSWFKCPTKLVVNIFLLAVRLSYGVASVWEWNLSIFQVGVQVGWPFGLGYGPLVLILAVFETAGFAEENEDKVLIQQRVARGRIHDAELNITKKPNWWQKNFKDRYMSDEQRLKSMTNEVGGGRATSRRIGRNIELRDMNVGSRSDSRTPENRFRDKVPQHEEALDASVSRPGVPHTLQSKMVSTGTSTTGMTSTRDNQGRTSEVQPQQNIRSMLDV